MLSDQTPGGRPSRPPLSPQHVADLERSGLSAGQIAAAGLYSESDPASLNTLLGWKGGADRLGPCLVIPFVGSDGTPTGYARLKPDRPRPAGESGRAVKYESPKGQPNRAYFPPGTRGAGLADPAVPLVITEGEKKSLRADQDGFPCVGLVGVYAWQVRRPAGNKVTPRALIPDLQAVAWDGRRVFVAFDSDLADNPNVAWAEFHLAKALTRAGAVVRAVRLPAGPGGSKVGLDDYLIAHGADGLRGLIAAAVKVAKPTAGVSKAVATRPPPGPAGAPGVTAEAGSAPAGNDAVDDPHGLALAFLATHHDPAGRRTLRFWQAEFHEWAGGRYAAVADADIRGRLTAHVRAAFVRANAAAVAEWEAPGDDKKGGPPATRKVTTPLVANVTNALASLCRVPSDVTAPAWLDGVAGPAPAGLIAVANGLLDPAAVAAGRAEDLLPATPCFFTPAASPVAFDPAAREPAGWFAFLRQVLPGDPAGAALLQEWFGLMLTADTSYQKMLLLIGSGRNGKGVTTRVLAELVGPRNVVGPTLSGLAERFGLMPLLGTPVAIVGDCRLTNRGDAGGIVERLNNITGEDRVTVDRKGRAMLTVKLPTRFTISTNELPRLPDAAGAVAGRMLILHFTQTFRGKEDRGLEARLLTELPGMLRWAVAGLVRLTYRGKFREPASGGRLARQMADLASPVGAFVRDKCRVGPGECVTVDDLFTAWQRHCEAENRKEPGTKQTFGQQLQAAVPGLGERRPKQGGERWREYVGITLLPAGTTADDADDFAAVSGAAGPDPFAWPPAMTDPPAPGLVRSAGSAAPLNPVASEGATVNEGVSGDGVAGAADPADPNPVRPAGPKRRIEHRPNDSYTAADWNGGVR